MKANLLGKWAPDKGKRYATVAVRDIPGITAKIYKSISAKGYISYVLTFTLLGKRKVAFFADAAQAKTAGEDAIRRIAKGEQDVLTLANCARAEYQRAQVAMLHVVHAHQIDHRLRQLLLTIGQGHSIDLAGIHQAGGVFLKAEDPWTARCVVATNALEQ